MKLFSDLVDEIKKRSTEEKEELKFLIEKYLIEEKRDEIVTNLHESLKELKDRKLEFSSDVNRLNEML